jgi:hypothetical protein
MVEVIVSVVLVVQLVMALRMESLADRIGDLERDQ